MRLSIRPFVIIIVITIRPILAPRKKRPEGSPILLRIANTSRTTKASTTTTATDYYHYCCHYHYYYAGTTYDYDYYYKQRQQLLVRLLLLRLHVPHLPPLLLISECYCCY